MEEQRLAACAEKLKRLNEKHRQANEGKPASDQTTTEESGAAGEEAQTASVPASSPVPSIPVPQSEVPVVQAPLNERVDQDRERLEQAEPHAEEDPERTRQASPPIQRLIAVTPEPQGEGETSLPEVAPLVQENQTDQTSAPIRDYFNMEDNRGRPGLGKSFVNIWIGFSF